MRELWYANVAVIGASGGIGAALADRLDEGGIDNVFRLARTAAPGSDSFFIDIRDETSIAEAAAAIKARAGALDLVIVATGVLQDSDGLKPEKLLRAVTADAMEAAFRTNAIGPALVAKHFLPLLRRDTRTVFAALSARVGSISDNRLGGWYSYRASKAALNMVIRTAAIELARTRPQGICVGLHPGTVATPLSAPFQRGVPTPQLFSPERAADLLLDVIEKLTPGESGYCLAWDGSVVPF
jgi:NAD(P)-dependent dehydrogenase (short-subunit alcohol dehydrogenase family)